MKTLIIPSSNREHYLGHCRHRGELFWIILILISKFKLRILSWSVRTVRRNYLAVVVLSASTSPRSTLQVVAPIFDIFVCCLLLCCCCCCCWHDEEQKITYFCRVWAWSGVYRHNCQVNWQVGLPLLMENHLFPVLCRIPFLLIFWSIRKHIFSGWKIDKNFLLYHIYQRCNLSKDFSLSQALLARKQGALQCRHHKETQGWKCFL